jgi:hypothetical protein
MDWYKEVKEVEQSALPDFGRLANDYLLPGKPAVIRGALRGTGLGSWSLDYLKERVGGTRVRVVFSRDDAGNAVQPHKVESTLAEFIDKRVTVSAASGAASTYLQQTSIPALFPELVPDIPVSKFIRPDLVTALNLWLGPPNTVSRLHYDRGNNFLIQVYGEKRIILFETWQTPALYPNPVIVSRQFRAHFSAVDLSNPDFDAHPNLRDATPSIVHLKPGDVLFIPACCWHEVHGLTASISVNIWWQPLDEQLLLPAYTRLIPAYFYERPPNFFHRSIQHSFDSFTDYARALRSIGEDRISALCYVMLLERYLELRGQERGLALADCSKELDVAVVGLERLDAPAEFARRLFAENALSRDELRRIEGWLDLGRRLLSFATTAEAERDAMQDAIAALTDVPDLEPPSRRVRFEDLVSA